MVAVQQAAAALQAASSSAAAAAAAAAAAVAAAVAAGSDSNKSRARRKRRRRGGRGTALPSSAPSSGEPRGGAPSLAPVAAAVPVGMPVGMPNGTEAGEDPMWRWGSGGACSAGVGWSGQYDSALCEEASYYGDRSACVDAGPWCRADGGTGPPLPVNQPYGSAAEVAVGALTGATILFAMGLWVRVVVRNSNDRVIVSHCFFHLSAVCWGFILLLIGVLLWPLTPTEPLCVAKLWFFAVGYGMVASALLVRLFRVYHVFYLALNPKRSLSEVINYNSAEAVERRNRNILIIVGVTILSELLLVAVMTGVSDLRPEVMYTCCQSSECVFTSCTINVPWSVTALVLNLLPWCAGLFWLAKLSLLRRELKAKHKAEEEDAAKTAAAEAGETAAARPTAAGGSDNKNKLDESASAIVLRRVSEQLEVFYPALWLILSVFAAGAVVIGLSMAVDTRSTAWARQTVFYVLRSVLIILFVWGGLAFQFLPVIATLKTKLSSAAGSSRASSTGQDGKGGEDKRSFSNSGPESSHASSADLDTAVTDTTVPGVAGDSEAGLETT